LYFSDGNQIGPALAENRRLRARTSASWPGGHMNIAANAVTDVAPPTPPPTQAAARDASDVPRFQDHLDAHQPNDDESAADAQLAPVPSQAKPAKAKTDSSAATTDASNETQDGASANATTEQISPRQPDTSEKPAHAFVLQLSAEKTEANGDAASAAQTASAASNAQQQQTAQSTQVAQATANAQANAPQSTAQAVETKLQPSGAPTTKSVKTTQAQPATGQGKEKTKASRTAAPEITAPQAAVTAPPTPTPQAAPVSVPQAADTGAAANGKTKDLAITPAGLDASHTMPRAAPHAPAAPPPAGDEKADSAAPQAAAHGAKSGVNTATSPKTAAPNFRDILGAATGSPIAATPAAHAATTNTTAATPANMDTQQAAIDPTAARAAPVASQVAQQIVRRANGDNTRFELRLDPPELGKIQVRLDVSRDHKVTAVVSADNPQALNELSRGARDLQQALQSAGLDLSDDRLSFDLSNQQGGFSQPHQGGDNASSPAPMRSAAADTQSSIDTSLPRARPLSIESWRGSRIDVMA
jgi:hypothetical protein